MTTRKERGAATHPPAESIDSPTGTLAGPMRQLVPIFAMGTAIFVLGAVGPWVGDSWITHVIAGIAGGLLLGVLLAGQPGVLITVAHGAVALAAFAGGALAMGVAPIEALLEGAGLAAVGLLAYWMLHMRRIQPAGLQELAPFVKAAALGVLMLPLGHALVTASGFAASGDVASGLWRIWVACSLGVLMTLPVALAWPTARVESWSKPMPGHPREAFVLGGVAWLTVVAVMWWRPDLLILGLVPMVVVAARMGPRATAWLGLATGIAIAVLSIHPANTPRAAPEAIALTVAAVLVATLAIAILAAHRDRVAHALATAEEHLRAVTERAPTIMATLDLELRHLLANRNYLQWAGKEAAQVIGQTVQQVYGDDAGFIAAPIRRAFGGQPQHQQIELPDGRILDANIEPRFGPDGPVDGVYLLAQDASWQSAHERSLDAMLAGAFEPTLVLDSAGAILRLNDKIEGLFGSTREALIGQPLAAWLEAPADTALSEALEKVRVRRTPQQLLRSLELHARRADGSTFPIELHLAPMEGGRSIQTLVAIHDLAPRLAWEELMAGSRGQAELTIAALADAMVACDLQERITLFNPAAARMSGWSEADAMGKPLGDVLRFIDPANSAALPSLVREALRANAVVRQKSDRLLLRGDGERAAVTESAAPIRDRFGQASGGVLLIQDVSQAHAIAQSLAHQAQHDHLTGLPNRVLLQDRLLQALAQMERGFKGALLYLDLDRFKPINDKFGHPVGDRVLQEVASRLRAGVRDDDTVSRQGGDEFVLLLVRLADPRDAARVAEKLIHAIEQPIHINGNDLTLSASIGIALFSQDGRDIRTLTQQADAALYHAKHAGRGRYSYFTDIIGVSAEERMRTEHDIRIALSNGDFFLEWQPQVELPQRRLSGVEGLVRWRKADGVVGQPEEFISVAEETGLVVEIDEWVLHEACAQNRRWQDQGLPNLPVSVNVSLARFDAERLLAHVRAVLLETGLAPQWLEIEFKGAQLFAEGPRGQALVAELKAMGVRVSADDFGSGPSSLGALTHFAFNTLKIDRLFVRTIVEDASSRAVVKATLGIGRAMGYRIVAKGVETDAQHDALIELGCTEMQGLKFGDAASAARFAEWAGQGVFEHKSREA
jgi:diguanylate cyclase (GGDEF)-like protein/PAS domain S-box-containing protein